MKIFQTVLLVVFGAFFVGALIFFAANKSKNSQDLAPITVWGTVSADSFNDVIRYIENDMNLKTAFKKAQITYVEKQDASFDSEFIEALANGAGPDAVIISQDMLLRHKNKFLAISAESLPPRNYKDWFVPIAGLFQDGIATYALPLFVDPMVMYWNIDTLANAGYTTPPRGWVEMPDFAKNITKRDSVGNIRQSAVALGEYGNITNAKDLIAGLFLQAGVPITAYNNLGKIDSVMSNAPFSGDTKDAINQGLTGIEQNDSSYDRTTAGQDALHPGVSALRFYTDFANPAKKIYSWNRGLPRARDAFSSGDTALYFGFASEKPLIQAKNPNLNFDVASMPQMSGVRVRSNFGRVYGFAVVAKSPAYVAAYTVGTMLIDPTVSAYFARAFYAAPARAEALAPGFVANAGRVPGSNTQDSDANESALAREANQTIFNQAALSARGWLDPDRFSTSGIFKAMVDSVVSGQASPSQAFSAAESRITSLLQSR